MKAVRHSTCTVIIIITIQRTDASWQYISHSLLWNHPLKQNIMDKLFTKLQKNHHAQLERQSLSTIARYGKSISVMMMFRIVCIVFVLFLSSSITSIQILHYHHHLLLIRYILQVEPRWLYNVNPVVMANKLRRPPPLEVPQEEYGNVVSCRHS